MILLKNPKTQIIPSTADAIKEDDCYEDVLALADKRFFVIGGRTRTGVASMVLIKTKLHKTRSVSIELEKVCIWKVQVT